MTGRAQIALCVAFLAEGLYLDMQVGLAGQAAIGFACFALLSHLVMQAAPQERRALMACLVIATAGELILSLGWGLYTYRLDNVPLFVPPGHVMLYVLGLSLSRRMPEIAAEAIIALAGLYALGAAAAGLDTLGVPLFLMLAIASLAVPAQRRLYASTFLLALALELYGTWLGNWSWAREVPGTALVTTNPPLAAGAFYAALDALVAASVACLFRSKNCASSVEPCSAVVEALPAATTWVTASK